MENESWILGKRNTWGQILFWGGLWMLIPYLINVNSLESMPSWREETLIARNLITFIGIAILIFVNIEVFIPRFYEKQQTMAYIIGCLLLLGVIVFLMHWEHAPWAEWTHPSARKIRPGGFRPRFKGGVNAMRTANNMRYIGSSMPFLTSFLGSSLFEIARLASKREKEAVKLQKEKLETEMKFLKSQINPHFLFNSLNNIYTLILVNSDKAAPNLLKLSEMLRYMLYDCNGDRVPLNREIAYIRNYVDLMKLKDSQGLNVQLNLSERHPDMMVAPLLFIPFIENAFKHSQVEDLSKGWIHIKLETEDEQIRLFVENSVPQTVYRKDEVGGIGLQNVKKQLQLIYPDKHELSIHQLEDKYEVSLTIHLS